MIPSRAASAARTSASCSPSGAPRLAGGPPMGSVARKAVMKSARSSTARLGSTNSAADGFSPATQRHTDHGQPNPSAGLPNPTGTGLATPRCAAIRGSHCCSVRRLSMAQPMRGMRTARSSPSRYIALSVPAERTGAMGRSAHCGNCARSRRRTRSSSISTSSACIFALRTRSYRSKTVPSCSQIRRTKAKPARNATLADAEFSGSTLITASVAPCSAAYWHTRSTARVASPRPRQLG
ncbi:Uncharacterised protein [Mycobacterium tuberculosis]|nr:Uncharacterised protein [Mycobacterium tuberculosis]